MPISLVDDSLSSLVSLGELHAAGATKKERYEEIEELIMKVVSNQLRLVTAIALLACMTTLPPVAYAYDSQETQAVVDTADNTLGNRQANAKDEQLDLSVNRALEQIPAKASDFEKAKILHDYLVLNCAYDYDYIRTGTADSESYTAYGALVLKKAVCAGYSKAYQLMCESAGLACKKVRSATHAWNLVQIGGKWYHVDCTGDDPTPNKPNYVRYTYFLLSDRGIADYSKYRNFWSYDGDRSLPAATSATYESGAYAAKLKPAKVKNVKAVAKKGRITVTWTKAKGVSGYVVFCKSSDGSWKRIPCSANATSKTISKLAKGKTWQVKVRAYTNGQNKVLYGSWSKAIKVRAK